MNTNIVIATDSNFQKEVLESALPVLVDFWAPWCGPCRIVAPTVEELADEYAGRFKVAKLNTDDNMETAVHYGIMSIPTLGIFQYGEMVDTLIGAYPKRALKAKMEEHLSRSKIN